MSFGGMTPEAGALLGKSLAQTADTNAQIDAASKWATNYDEDDRPCIKADVMNAYFQGIKWGRENPAPVEDAG